MSPDSRAGGDGVSTDTEPTLADTLNGPSEPVLAATLKEPPPGAPRLSGSEQVRPAVALVLDAVCDFLRRFVVFPSTSAVHADAIGISRARCYELIKEETIPSIKIGGSIRVPVDALRAWISAELEIRSVSHGR